MSVLQKYAGRAAVVSRKAKVFGPLAPDCGKLPFGRALLPELSDRIVTVQLQVRATTPSPPPPPLPPPMSSPRSRRQLVASCATHSLLPRATCLMKCRTHHTRPVIADAESIEAKEGFKLSGECCRREGCSCDLVARCTRGACSRRLVRVLQGGFCLQAAARW